MTITNRCAILPAPLNISTTSTPDHPNHHDTPYHLFQTITTESITDGAHDHNDALNLHSASQSPFYLALKAHE